MIVITGGAGFIGSNLLAALSESGEHDVVVCDRLGHDEKWRNISKHELADFLTPDELIGFLEVHGRAVDAVFHLGAVSSTTETDNDLIVQLNLRLSLDLWRWCAEHEVRLIYASSAATYGDGAQGFDDDGSCAGLARLRPLNAYGWSKHAFDRRVARMIERGEPRPPQWAGLKFFNVYGPNEYHKGGQRSVALQVFEQAKAKGVAKLFRSHHPVYPDGGQRRDFVWVGDAVDVMRWLYQTPSVNGLFNVGTGKARSFKDLAKAVFAGRGLTANVEYVDTPAALRDKYQYFTEARMQRLRDAGYDHPFTELEDGIATYVGSYLQKDDPYR